MATMTVKNRSSKISPGGVVTLPLSARKALRMVPGKGSRVTAAAEKGGISLKPTSDQAGIRVSPRGQMELPGELRAVLERGATRNVWLELNDKDQRVVLHPYT